MKRIMGFALCLLVLLIWINPAVAQDDENWESVQISDGLLAVSYPVGWFVELDINKGGFFLASSEAAHDYLVGDAETLEEGEGGVAISFFPVDLSDEILDIEIDDDTELDDLAHLIAVEVADESGDAEAYDITDGEMIELDDEREIGAAELHDDDIQALVTVWIQDDLLILAMVVSHVDAFDEFEEIGLRIITSFEMTGTLEDLETLLFPEPTTETTE